METNQETFKYGTASSLKVYYQPSQPIHHAQFTIILYSIMYIGPKHITPSSLINLFHKLGHDIKKNMYTNSEENMLQNMT